MCEQQVVERKQAQLFCCSVSFVYINHCRIMPGFTSLKTSSHVPQAMGSRLERRGDRFSNFRRRPRRSRSFRNRSDSFACETNREGQDVKKGKSSLSNYTISSMLLSENLILSMESHGEKVRCLIKLMGHQRQLFEQFQRFPIMQLQARRFRSLFALAQHFDSKSTAAAATKLNASQEITSGNEPEQRTKQLGEDFSQMSLSL